MTRSGLGLRAKGLIAMMIIVTATLGYRVLTMHQISASSRLPRNTDHVSSWGSGSHLVPGALPVSP